MKTYGVVKREDLSISDTISVYEIDAKNPEAALNKVIREDKSDRYREHSPGENDPAPRFRNSYTIYEQNGHSLEDNKDEYDEPNENLLDLWTEVISDIAETY